MFELIIRNLRKVKSKFTRTTAVTTTVIKYKTNIFNKDYKRKALLSFIVYPYLTDTNRPFHTQVNECISICEILDELGYIVDITDYDNYDDSFLQEHYDLVIGFGEPVEKILYRNIEKNFLLISYRNGSDNVFSDKVSLERMYEFYKQKKVVLAESCLVNPESWRIQIKFADRIIVLGNKYTRQSFEGHTTGRLDSLDLFFNNVGTIDLEKKDFVQSKNHFLWFGTRGAIHKGLDLLLDFFSKNPHLHLHVAGLNKSETNFINYYETAFELPNIHNIGFIAIDTLAFKDLMYQCSAVISPTVSEGQSGAVLNVMAAGGLIPIVTSNVGIDLEDMAIMIKGFTLNDIEISLNEFNQLSLQKLQFQSEKIIDFIRKKHTEENYRANLKKIINEGIKYYESKSDN